MLPDSPAAQPRVLVVDDDPLILQLHEAILSRSSFKVTAAEDPTNVVDAVRSGEVDLVLLDSKMPTMSGLEVLTEIRASGLTTPVIMVTAASEVHERVDGLESGADDYIAKPVEPRELLARVQALLRSRRAAVDEAASASRSAEELLRTEIQAIIDNEMFMPVYQPIVDLPTRRVVAHEALTRFIDGRRPDHCFNDAARLGLGADLGLATLRAAIERAVSLPPGTSLHLNVAPSLLADPRLDALLSTCDREIVVELTEHDPIEDYEEAARLLARFEGVKTAVDDAGAGYASMTHVLALDPDEVKLDREWVRGLDEDLPRRALIAGMVSFAAATGTVLVAEGVETEGEALTLTALGVRRAQGFHLGRPAPAPRLLDPVLE